jgi:glycerol-3-phosphate O-acyltransferase
MSRGRPWTADDAAQLRRLIAAGETDARIAQAMDRHPDLIRRRRRAAGLAPGQSRAATVMMMRLNRRRLGKKVAGKYEKETP